MIIDRALEHGSASHLELAARLASRLGRDEIPLRLVSGQVWRTPDGLLGDIGPLKGLVTHDEARTLVRDAFAAQDSQFELGFSDPEDDRGP